MQFQMSRVKPLLFTLMFGVSAERNREIQAECKVTFAAAKTSLGNYSLEIVYRIYSIKRRRRIKTAPHRKNTAFA